jgi:hypothetical protein
MSQSIIAIEELERRPFTRWLRISAAAPAAWPSLQQRTDCCVSPSPSRSRQNAMVAGVSSLCSRQMSQYKMAMVHPQSSRVHTNASAMFWGAVTESHIPVRLTDH